MGKFNIDKKSPLFLVIVVALVLLFITICFTIASSLTMKAQKNWYSNETARINEENAKLENEYNLQRAEFEKSLVIEDEKERPQPNSEGWEVVDYTEFPVENAQTQTIARSQFLKGPLILVNSWHQLPSDYESVVDSDLTSIGKTTGAKVQVQNYNLRLFPQAIEKLKDMLSFASSNGNDYYIVREGFRTGADQTALYEKERNKLAEKYSGEILNQKVLENVNYPGTSEYQSGYTVRFGLYNKEDVEISRKPFQETEQGKFLTENSWKYGFVFRFPVSDFPQSSTIDKSYLTGVSIKLNAYRYVGEAAAAIMNSKNFVLEEFLEYLVEHPHIKLYYDRELKYEITRTPLADLSSQSVDIQVPLAARSAEYSFDNLGGVVSVFAY